MTDELRAEGRTAVGAPGVTGWGDGGAAFVLGLVPGAVADGYITRPIGTRTFAEEIARCLPRSRGP